MLDYYCYIKKKPQNFILRWAIIYAWNGMGMILSIRFAGIFSKLLLS